MSAAASNAAPASSRGFAARTGPGGISITRHRTDPKVQQEMQQQIQEQLQDQAEQAGASASATPTGQGLGLGGGSRPEHLQGPELEISKLQQQVHELWSQNKIAEAREVAEAVKLTVESFYGDKHPVYASVLNNLALMHKQVGEFDEAVKSLSEAIRIYKDTVGDDHLSTVTAMGNLGQLYKTYALNSKGMEKHSLLTHAKTFFATNMEALKSLKGEESPDYGMAMQNYGAVLRLLNDKEDSMSYVEGGRNIIVAALDAEHPRVATARNNMGLELKLQGRFELAEKEYKEALRIRQAKLGGSHSETIIAMHNLAELYMAWGKDADAHALQQQVLDELGVDKVDLEDEIAGDGSSGSGRS
ncbi:Kinesin light chain [Hondaea fermentalgiana]|uniref:Kinesin light chain n=1 Tax=Hondaea fermentalgiana TaxID=2315210 RepID=A0A2R5H0W2_9STRA|nr:Kinesin light chain [Hondaea fermentalgiana]|eukprot:GBG34411.1 Kinesin light chain [Hondaea fermentalgiana]